MTLSPSFLPLPNGRSWKLSVYVKFNVRAFFIFVGGNWAVICYKNVKLLSDHTV